MRLLLVLAALLASTPVEAHCFARWHYPWPQRCGAVRQMVRLARVIPNQEHAANEAATRATRAIPDGLEIPLPSLARADLDGGEADEAVRAKVLLRAALEVSSDPLQ